MDGAPGVVKGLIEGDIQFGNLAASSPLKAVLLGDADTVFVTGGINQQFLVGRPGIKNRNELSGGRIAIAGDGGFNDILVHIVIEQLENQGIRKVGTAWSVKRSIDALVQRECDAAIFSPRLAIVAKHQGCNFLVDFAEFGLNYALGGTPHRREPVLATDRAKRLYRIALRRALNLRNPATLPHPQRLETL